MSPKDLTEVSDEVYNFVMDILERIVTEPNSVACATTIQAGKVCVLVNVADKDVGIVIGKDGENFKAIQRLANCLGARLKCHIHLEIDNPTKSQPKGAKRTAKATAADKTQAAS